ncbi:MAG: hypothetical protein JXR14_02080 [Paracoccaceae bacterium]
MILWSFLAGMAFCGLTLALLHADDARMTDKFAAAGATFSAWCAFGMLLMAGLYGLGLVVPGLAALAVLGARKSKLGLWLTPLAPYKLPLGIGALLGSILTWIGVLNLMEDLPNV